RAAKRKAALDGAHRIFELHDDGHTAPEIAAALGASPTRIRKIAKARGVLVSRSLKTVRRAIPLPVAGEAALKQLAADCGATPLRCAHAARRVRSGGGRLDR